MKKLIIKSKYHLTKDEEMQIAQHFKKLQTTFTAFANPKDVAQYLPKKLRSQVESIKEKDEDVMKDLMQAVVQGITLEDEKKAERIYELRVAAHPFPDVIIDNLLNAVGAKAKRQFRFIESVELVSS